MRGQQMLQHAQSLPMERGEAAGSKGKLAGRRAGDERRELAASRSPAREQPWVLAALQAENKQQKALERLHFAYQKGEVLLQPGEGPTLRWVLARMCGEGEQGDAGQEGAQAGPYKCCRSKGIFREGMRCWRLGRGLLGSHYHIELTCRQNEKKKRKKKILELLYLRELTSIAVVR